MNTHNSKVATSPKCAVVVLSVVGVMLASCSAKPRSDSSISSVETRPRSTREGGVRFDTVEGTVPAGGHDIRRIQIPGHSVTLFYVTPVGDYSDRTTLGLGTSAGYQDDNASPDTLVVSESNSQITLLNYARWEEFYAGSGGSPDGTLFYSSRRRNKPTWIILETQEGIGNVNVAVGEDDNSEQVQYRLSVAACAVVDSHPVSTGMIDRDADLRSAARKSVEDAFECLLRDEGVRKLLPENAIAALRGESFVPDETIPPLS